MVPFKAWVAAVMATSAVIVATAMYVAQPRSNYALDRHAKGAEASIRPLQGRLHQVELAKAGVEVAASSRRSVVMEALGDRLDVVLLKGDDARRLCPNPHAASQGCEVNLVITCCPAVKTHSGDDGVMNSGEQNVAGASGSTYIAATASCKGAGVDDVRVYNVPAFYDERGSGGDDGGGGNHHTNWNDGPAFRIRWRMVSGDEAARRGSCDAVATFNGSPIPQLAPMHIHVVPRQRRVSTGVDANQSRTRHPFGFGFARVASNHQYFTQTVSHATSAALHESHTADTHPVANKRRTVDGVAGPDMGSTEPLLWPVGPNLAWSGGTNTTRSFYGPNLDSLAAAGASYVRLWLGPSQVAASPFSDTQLQRELGKVDATAAANFDWVLARCEANGIRALLALESYNSLCTNTVYFCSWDNSVYKGPLAQPDDFWRSNTTTSAFRDYARAVVARWGASPAVFSWQLFNEMDGAIGGTSSDATAWMASMVDYIKSIDVHGHLVDNSYAEESGVPADDALQSVDFTTTHAYESGDLGGTLSHYSVIKAATFHKPTFSGEFGRNADPRLTRTILHNGMWGTVAQLGAASGACWWWDTLFTDKLLDEYTAIAAFVSHLPLTSHNWTIISHIDGVPQGARVLAQASTEWSFVVGYVLNMDSTFGRSGGTIPPFALFLRGCPGNEIADGGGDPDDGRGVALSLQWFNTSSGSPIGSSSAVVCQGGAINLTTPLLATDCAFTISVASA